MDAGEQDRRVVVMAGSAARSAASRLDNKGGGQLMSKRGRPATIGKLVLQKAAFYRTVAELARETGAQPGTVRDVLRRAADRGDIRLRRFFSGKCFQTILVEK